MATSQWTQLTQAKDKQNILLALGIASVLTVSAYYLLSAPQKPRKQREDAPVKEVPKRKREQSMFDFQSATTGTKTIYFDQNDNMYTQDEIKGLNAKLTKMVVRVPEQERVIMLQEQERHKTKGLEAFVLKIQSSKSEYFGKQSNRSQPFRNQQFSQFSSSLSNKETSHLNLQPHHFKNKDGALFLNMFETLSNNYVLHKETHSDRHREGRNAKVARQMSQIQEEGPLEQSRQQRPQSMFSHRSK